MFTTKCDTCQMLITIYDAAVKAYTESNPDQSDQSRQEREQLRVACLVAKFEFQTHALSDRLVSRSRGL